MKVKVVFLLLLLNGAVMASTGPYLASVETVQASSHEIGSGSNTAALNSVYLNMDITNSPCSGTNTNNRFTLSNNTQYTMALTAFTAGKSLEIRGTGVCVNNIEQISTIKIRP